MFLVELLLFWLTSLPVGAFLSSGAENHVCDKKLDESRTGIIYTENANAGYANEMGHGTRIFVVGLSTDSDVRPGDQT